MDKTAIQVIKKHARMQAARVNWDAHWQEVAEYVIPKKDDVYGTPVKGEKKENKLFTSVSVTANETLASALHGMLTNPATTWFGLSTGDKDIDKQKEVKKWLQESAEMMIEVMNYSNFQTEVHEVYLDLGGFGTSIMRVEEDDELVVRYESRPIYEAYIEEDYRGMVDTVSYEYKKTIREIADEFGKDKFDDDMIKMLAESDTTEFCIIHLVKPRNDYDPELKNPTNKKFASYHVLKEKEILLREGGFDDNPYIVPRWTKLSSEIYGRSPGMKALSDIKMINAMKKTVIQGAQLTVLPILQAPDDGVLLPIKQTPGSINYYRAGTQDRIEALNTGARPDIGEQLIDKIEMSIKEAFFIDQLQIRMADRMTATEVMQRREEQLRMLGPILGRMHFEFLRPLVNRTFNIMAKKNMFKPAPQQIQDMELKVRYTSQIARVQKTSEVDNLSRVLGLVAPLAQAKPDMLDNFSSDAILRDLVDQFQLPADYLNSDEQVMSIRQARAQAQQAQIERQTAAQDLELAGMAQGLQGQ